jgi:hypothetical protein
VRKNLASTGIRSPNCRARSYFAIPTHPKEISKFEKSELCEIYWVQEFGFISLKIGFASHFADYWTVPRGSTAPARTTPHTTPHHTTPHHTAPHHTTPHLTTSHHTPHHTTHRTAPHTTTLHHTAPHLTTSHHTTPHRTAPHTTTLHHTG